MTCAAACFLRSASVFQDSPFGFGEHGYLLNNVSCTSSEQDIGQCQSSPWNDTSCDVGSVATVYCRVLGAYKITSGNSGFS
ncbi:hypothetical protein DPMN_024402 [Dreissena polymorpha]|uniref:SRCR domain-containing protein n=1 Tax=Dreissena polymorpha TaxID=45954 RepID=A0A9D4LMH6_DREPO|nr:hypothetical protein DPMN_024402 [Dreissena polymorpha]